MSISITDLKLGERVVLNCPRGRANKKRQAQFNGIFHSVQDAMSAKGGLNQLVVLPDTESFLNAHGNWATFLVQTVSSPDVVLRSPGGEPLTNLRDFPGITHLMMALLIDMDGGLRDEEGRRVFIERRVFMGQG